ncbi:MAG: hypothetical protein E7666_02205 [Ruminococcaceae bacterium]|nr:hypothetical protein [Oscillospiraceae bacterium]
MKKVVFWGLAASVAVGVSAAIVGKMLVGKVVSEIQGEMLERSFHSPQGDHCVTLTYGASQTAKGLTYIKIQATAEGSADCCKLIVFAKEGADLFTVTWLDNDHLQLQIGSGARKQCCDVSFEEEQINARYYLSKRA